MARAYEFGFAASFLLFWQRREAKGPRPVGCEYLARRRGGNRAAEISFNHTTGERRLLLFRASTEAAAE